ncbi:hypothetical protein [Microviridae sp.]|nr:hypothetical protein [Microviridae sp.]
MRFMAQIIRHDDGRRSDPFVTDMDKLREFVLTADLENNKDDYVLLIGTVDENNELKVNNSPLVSINTMTEMFEMQAERRDLMEEATHQEQTYSE